MTDTVEARVAVYIDFDNIVISRYDQVHGRGQFIRDRSRGTLAGDAHVDVGAILDFAASYGTLVLTRAYADWSAPVNAEYRGQLVGRAVDLVQLFPAAAYAKNGADIRLAVDAVEDMFRLEDLSHVVIVGGDSDYVPLAQRCKRLGRYVVGIGVAGSTARSLAAACDEFVSYDDLPGIVAEGPDDVPAPATASGSVAETTSTAAEAASRSGGRSRKAASTKASKKAQADETAARGADAGPGESAPSEGGPSEDTVGEDAKAAGPSDETPGLTQADATRLFTRALRVVHRRDDAEWLHSSVVKSQMKRMDPSFSEKALGFRSFSDFVKSRADVAELDESGTTHLVRQREEARRR
ncbi:conserved hypothetical protein [Nostocoides japonicum T1-X7]|uniref:HTH OST-type domain-containing protein n=1 Tax=Nostocoides japonicum T1-X7 TaxID=1194083 RepID=A0A077LU71_9MICO|nr:NYN domain-containing protein [Tetrasphaera japonica]CCH77021.1 conserved hypothetical protein [Tetrasphaera japonica T1-X7]